MGIDESHSMSTENTAEHAAPNWFVPPGEGDFFAVVAIVILVGGLYLLVYLYAAFDRWAEHKSQGTPLAKTIPTLLAIALLYELFPLNHFHILLPLSAILIALMADWSRFHLNFGKDAVHIDKPEPPHDPAPNTEKEESANV
ncbi:hypothetical protein [Shimia abyssi]|uniref:Uncharacterized protein n=1 Tax=Shimia abyssi TaxID=1662395 RepID=A0A2P8F9I4_9RHOB|nr:hypothetical protein [Shimia abyssi]PSL18387.1 hypothetical protein CLV88_111133 [Shimia abyssi]